LLKEDLQVQVGVGGAPVQAIFQSESPELMEEKADIQVALFRKDENALSKATATTIR
jgi:hypothetical protein